MNHISELKSMKTRSRWLFLVGLIALGILANTLQVSVLFNVYFVFGSVAVMLAIVWLGMPAAILVGVIAGLYTYLIWQNPVTVVVFILEAICVGWLYHRKIKNLIISSLVFWLIVAVPIDLVFFPLLMGWSSELTLLVTLKQAVNGVLNAVIATSLLILGGLLNTRCFPQVNVLMTLRHLLFLGLLSVALLAGIPPILYDGHAMRQNLENNVHQSLLILGNELKGRLTEPGAQQRYQYHLERVSAGQNVSISLLNLQNDVVGQVGDVSSLAQQGRTLTRPASNQLTMWLPGNVENSATRFAEGRYMVTIPAEGVGGVDRIVLEMPALPAVRAMEAYRIVLFLMLSAVLGLGIVVAELLSRMMASPLQRIGRTGRRLSHTIASGEQPQLPSSRVVEFQQLSDLLSEMSGELSGTFKALKTTQSSLESEVAQRTQALASSNNLLRSVLDAAVDFSIIATDKNGVIQLFNKGATAMLGYAAKDVVGINTPLLFHDVEEIKQRFGALEFSPQEKLSLFEMLIYSAGVEKSDSKEWIYLTREGKKLPVKLVATTIQNQQGEVTGYLGIAEDITETKRIERMKNEFIATVSHELRTPLTSISGALGMVSAGALGQVPDSVMQMVGIAHKNSLRLTHLINDLLDIEKIAAGKLAFDMQWQPLEPLLSSAIEENRHYQSERDVTLTLLNNFPDAQVRVDGQRLQQVMANLLSNAVKFSPVGGEVTVSVDVQPRQVVVTVEDHGSGIPDAFKDLIFNKFSQVDASDSRAKGGTGLGLAISRELVEHMGGAMGFISQEGEGSRFWFSLPVQIQAAEKTKVVSDVYSASVLIVEDDVEVSEVLQTMLVQAGYSVDMAFSGGSALAKLADNNYDAITLDIGLPDMSGFEIVHALRQEPKTQHIPVLVVSGTVERGEVALKGHLDDIAWLAKPIQTNHLLSLLQQQINSNRRRLELLHIEDDTDLHAVIRTMLIDHAVCHHVPSVLTARRSLASHRYDVIILDIGLPDGEGWELLEQIRQAQPDARVVILSGQAISEADHHKVECVFLKSRISAAQLLDTIHQRTTLAKVTHDV